MIVTHDYVFINNPRTGSSYVRKALRATYGPDWSDGAVAGATATELILPVRRGTGTTGWDHHGTVSQIPAVHAGKNIISVVRNPYTLLVSLFELGLWRRRACPGGTSASSFEAFLHTQTVGARLRWGVAAERAGFGPVSLHFVQMFASNPEEAFETIASGATPCEVGRKIPPITFLRQEQLINELSVTLGRWLDAAQVERLMATGPTHITARSRLWSAALFETKIGKAIRRDEDFIFQYLAEQGIVYDLENADFTQLKGAAAALEPASTSSRGGGS